MENTYYTAVGHFRRRTNEGGQSYPVIIVSRQEYPVDIQEMAVWSILSWQLLNLAQIKEKYEQLAKELPPMEQRTLDMCLTRLQMRGLVSAGTGGTDFEAIYDLLGGLYVVPLAESLPLRLVTFLKLICGGIPLSKARQLFRQNKPNNRERQVMELARQALLSTAELIKCAEAGVRDVSTGEKIMEALYNDDDTTSENIMYEMLNAKHREPVTLAVANLYLRRQIIFERV